MRIRLGLSVSSDSKVLPVNYMYELSAWIYKTLNYGSPEFSEWLHSKGYISEKKAFKLFTFSQFDVPQYQVFNDRLKIRSDEVYLIISFLPIKAVETFVAGIFIKQSLSIGDKKSKVDFYVKSVERLPDPEFSSTMRYRCLSPIFIDKAVEGQKYKSYLSPRDQGYETLFSTNLISKTLAHEEQLSIRPEAIKLKHFGKIRKKGITIKANTRDESKLIGYMFDFELQAAPEIQRIGFYSGFGRLNSQGFGCCEIIR
ncbi:MAG: CRISPR-associated endoribonuclease Cas6 [Bacteroidota bacterium]|nr:CRISPR-associated endoribonuclease Cas6 [Bacteroidota bacterium]